MTNVIDFTNVSYIKKLESQDKFAVIEELARVFEGTGVCGDADELVKALIEREQMMSTGIGFGIAIPHAKIKSVKEMAFAIGITPEGIDFDSMDGEPVHLIILVAAGEKQHKEYLRLLSNIMAVIKQDEVKEKIINSDNPETILEILQGDLSK